MTKDELIQIALQAGFEQEELHKLTEQDFIDIASIQSISEDDMMDLRYFGKVLPDGKYFSYYDCKFYVAIVKGLIPYKNKFQSLISALKWLRQSTPKSWLKNR